jgi:hypothetical protein
MSRFRYAGDPLCLVACGCYSVNRWLVPLAWKGAFLRNHFNDTLLIPAALPLILWVHRRTGLRASDARPTWGEILLHFLAWSVAAELVAPHLFKHSTGDPWDVLAYAVGGLVSGLIWKFA